MESVAIGAVAYPIRSVAVWMECRVSPQLLGSHRIKCVGMNQVMAATSAYLVDSVPGKGASATAAGNLSRMVFSCVLSVAANPMVGAWGPGWTTVLLTSLTLVAMLVLLLLKVFGATLRF